MKKIFKNKKADFIGANVVWHILDILFFITVAVFVFFIVHVEKDIDTFPVESEILFYRMLYSNNGLWVYDQEIDRLYPGILDPEVFNDKAKLERSLNSMMYYGEENSRAAAELILEEQDGTKLGPIYYNEEKYKEWIEWYKAGVTKGPGARQGNVKNFHVLIKEANELVPGTLTITILIPNS